MIRSVRRILIVGLSALAPMVAPAQQTTGTITGTAREQGTGRPIPNARVMVTGTSIAVPTRDDGTYILRGVPTGSVEVRVLALGHAAQKQTVTVTADGTAGADFSLAPVAVQLEQLVTTAIGQARSVEVGNDIPKINAAEVVQTKPITNITDLLNARAPGVQVLAGTMVGTGQRIRIRGQNSLSLSNDPIFIIDGIRMQSSTGSSSIGIGGSTPSRISDIDPNQIESFEVVKGPSASTLYGTDAANGVIVITTKRGRVGRAKWNSFIQHGRIVDKNTYPTAYTVFGHSPTGAIRRTDLSSATCFPGDISLGRCIVDSVASFNLFANKETTPLAPAYEEEYGADVSGGSETARYFVHGSYSGEQGVYKVPQFEINRLLAKNGIIPGEQLRPNALTRATMRANMNLQLSPLADVAISTAFISSSQRLPQTENNTTGLTSSAYGGQGYRTKCCILGTTLPLNGYRAFTPGDMFQETVKQDINRFIGSLTPNWRPLSWLTARGNFGIDFTNRVDSDLCRQGQCSDFGSSRLGFKLNNRTNLFDYTFDLNSTAQFHLTNALGSKTTVGVQYYRSIFERNGAEGDILPPGATTVSQASVFFGSEASTYKVTAGSFVEHTFSLNDRLFLTGAFRADNNSAFGTKTSVVIYPKASLSWVVSEEPFFARFGFINQLRLRTAYGQSGTSPGTNDALLFYTASAANVADQGTAALFFSALGNPNLKPERATEVEGGLDLDMFDNRASITVTAYHKKTKDALVARTLPPSAGISAVRFENLGSVQNTGFEASVRGQIVQTRMIGLDANLAYSNNNNKLLSLGSVPPIIGTDIREIPGYPLFGVWNRKILGYNDINHDGILTGNEVIVSDSAVFLGRSSPGLELTFEPGMDLWNNMFRFTAAFDHKGRFVLKNSNERIRCNQRLNCFGLTPQASLAEQVRVVALRDHPSRTEGGFWENGEYTKLREIALTFTPPASWVQHRFIRADRLSITGAVRNVKTWTQFTGIDPEAAAGAQFNLQDPFQAVPPPRYYTFRFNFGF
ncbi:MAG TPA: SusC/RagA family TonB-linked outer membrane protein [Gemmatimonadaceae bacterium]|nr:SusC/RagA family TonB-linked outer membrane protein [Gemmatimonadaceae bacterium]